MNISIDGLEYTSTLPETSTEFVLSDEQFSSLLHSSSTSVFPTHYKPTFISKFNLEPTTSSVAALSNYLIESNEPIEITRQSIVTQHQPVATLTDQLTATHKWLKSSIQSYNETVEMISNWILKCNCIERILSLVHQLSLHSIDDIIIKEIENIPSFVLDLLKMNVMTENTYNSIKQHEISSDLVDRSNNLDRKSGELIDLVKSGNLSTAVIEGIQTYQLSFSQIYRIQTQLLTPSLLGKNSILRLKF